MHIETKTKLDHLSETKDLIREAIESKGQPVADTDTFRSYAEKINAIQSEPTLESLEVTENGTYTPGEGVDGFDRVTVEVPTSEITLQDKTITENGTFTADDGYDGLGSVTVSVEGSGGRLKYKKAYFTATGTFGQRVAVDFGFKPDFLMIYPISITLGSSVRFLMLGCSQNFADTLGVSVYNQRHYTNSSYKTDYAVTGSPIEATNANYFSDVDETGFTINENLKSGSWYFIAFGL